ncbi:MAG: restriction endonuclease subunit R [Hormoscilla sp.]
MVETISAKDVTLKQLKTIFDLQLAEDEQVFREWQDNLPEITDWQKQMLDRVKAGYFNLLYYPPLLEKPVNMAIVSPLLFIGEFYLSPFHFKAEKAVEISASDEEIVIKGSIDTLVLQEHLWVMVIESKRASFSIEAGLPQILAYMLANPERQKPCFGMITTGGTFIFIKLVKGEAPRYATSAEFSLRNPGNDLYRVLSILKRLSS